MTAGPTKCFCLLHGASGEGKTQYAKHVARARKNAPGGRLVIVDPVSTFDGYGEVVGVEEAKRKLKDAAGGGPLALVVRPRLREKIGGLWEWVFYAGGLLLVVDEAQRFGRMGNLDADFLAFTEVARNRWIDMLTTSQTPTTLHPAIRGNWDVLVTFRQARRVYASTIADEYFGKPDLADKIMRLPQLCYLRATVGGQISGGGPIPII